MLGDALHMVVPAPPSGCRARGDGDEGIRPAPQVAGPFVGKARAVDAGARVHRTGDGPRDKLCHERVEPDLVAVLVGQDEVFCHALVGAGGAGVDEGKARGVRAAI